MDSVSSVRFGYGIFYAETFTPMVFSRLPSEFLSPISTSSPSQYLYFHKFDAKIISLRSFRAQKLRISCCNQAVQLDGTRENSNIVKKKQKLKPSFLEQVQRKWSIKVPSLRENFPWEEENYGGGANQEVPVQSSTASEGVSSSDKENESIVPVSEVVNIHDKSKSNSAPWAHGNRQRKNVVNSDCSTKLEENVEKKEQGFDAFHEYMPTEESSINVIRAYDDLPKEVAVSEEQDGRFDEISVGMHDKIGMFGDEEREDINFLESSSSTYGNDRGNLHFAETNNVSRLPWERRIDKELVKGERLRNRHTDSAGRLIPEPELKRLRNVSLRMLERMKVGAGGMTQALVDAIHDKWRDEELVKLKFEGPPSKNMRRTHEILESRTGGLIIWRSGSSVVLYRGMAYNLDCVKSYNTHVKDDAGTLGSFQEESPSIKVHQVNAAAESSGVHKYPNNLSEKEQMNLSDINHLLDELGPRFTDWSGREPIPVDADLLPTVVPGYKAPFRLLPYGTRQALRDTEMTFLRRTARTLPPHFVIGRSRGLQGLAQAMVKLWEKSAIAVIAIKRGVLNTHNERMAEELKILTGGTLLSRNKEFIVFYRGNDFLPLGVSRALTEAEKYAAMQQDAEESARNRALTVIGPKPKASVQPLVAGTLAETVAATSHWETGTNNAEVEKLRRDAAVARHASNFTSLQRKLALAKGKIAKAEKALRKVLRAQEPADLPSDLETLTDEERAVLRRIGLSMKPYLLLGRREIFDGTIENMHLHWKHRELVKIIIERKTFSQVRHIAISLESESGGVLVSVERTAKGHAILVYRGKNYQRPLTFRPKSLLTKRQALARSIELQRREALKHHVFDLEEKVEKLKQEQEEMMAANCDGEETLNSRSHSSSDENDVEGRHGDARMTS